jgi:hypothetical protein
MLSTFLPKLSGSKLDSVLATQSFFVHFVPLSHPQEWLPAVFTLWQSFNSTIYDDQWLDLLARLAERHVDPNLSHPRLVEALKDAAEQHGGLLDADVPLTDWAGIRKDVGIFTDEEFSFIMSKCLRVMGTSILLGRTSQTMLIETTKGIPVGSAKVNKLTHPVCSWRANIGHFRAAPAPWVQPRRIAKPTRRLLP